MNIFWDEISYKCFIYCLSIIVLGVGLQGLNVDQDLANTRFLNNELYIVGSVPCNIASIVYNPIHDKQSM